MGTKTKIDSVDLTHDIRPDGGLNHMLNQADFDRIRNQPDFDRMINGTFVALMMTTRLFAPRSRSCSIVDPVTIPCPHRSGPDAVIWLKAEGCELTLRWCPNCWDDFVRFYTTKWIPRKNKGANKLAPFTAEEITLLERISQDLLKDWVASKAQHIEAKGA